MKRSRKIASLTVLAITLGILLTACAITAPLPQIRQQLPVSNSNTERSTYPARTVHSAEFPFILHMIKAFLPRKVLM